MCTQVTHPWQIEIQAEQKIRNYYREVAGANKMVGAPQRPSSWHRDVLDGIVNAVQPRPYPTFRGY